MECEIKRVDIFLDMKFIPKVAINNIIKLREPMTYKNTTYFKTDSEPKTNSTLDIKLYNKGLEAKLSYPLERLEFCFKSGYFKKSNGKSMKLKELDKTVIKKIKTTIKKFSGINPRILPM